jgi:RHS repeat-associated protein
MKYRLTLALVAFMTSTAFAAFQAPLPEFKNEKQLAEWRAEKASEATMQGYVAEGAAFYTGKPYLTSSGGYVFKYRSYNPEVARWTTEDPSGFPDGANSSIYAPKPTTEFDREGLRVQWIGEEDHYSPNATYDGLPATSFFWNVSLNGNTLLEGSYTGTFKQVYDRAATVGFVTWRGLTSGNFGDVHGLSLYSHSMENGNHVWSPNGYTVSAGFLENAGATDSDLAGVNLRINPFEAETSRPALRGLSTYLYDYLVSAGAGYNGELFYE